MFLLGLNANAVWLLDVAANDCPDNTEREHESGCITNERVTLVNATMQELEVLWQLVIEFKSCGDAKKNEETEVDHGVHETCASIAQQCLHIDTSAVVLQTILCVLRSGATTIGCTALPVANAVSKLERTPHQHDGEDCVEGCLQWTRDSVEHFT